MPPPERPPTPDVGDFDEEEDSKRCAVVLLQQLLRGRAVQNEMFDGKEKREDLIKELRTTHALRKAEQSLKQQEKETLLAQRSAQEKDTHRKETARAVASDVQAEAVGETLDFLSKELVRLQEERRVHAFMMLAERQRRIREVRSVESERVSVLCVCVCACVCMCVCMRV